MKNEVKKRGREEEEEAANFIIGVSQLPERELTRSMNHIKKQRTAGKPATKDMMKLLNLEADSESEMDSDCAESDHEYDLKRRLVSKEEKKASRNAHDTAPTKEDQLYRDVNRPDKVIDSELGDFESIFFFACLRALQEDFEKEFKTGTRTKEECLLVTKWLQHNIKTPLERLNMVVSKGEDSECRVSLFTQLMRSCSLQFQDPDDASTYPCAITSTDVPAEQCTRVVLVDDPNLFRPYSKIAEEDYDDTPRIYFIHSQYRNICYSVFHLRTLVDAIGARCIRWAKKQKILYTAGASRISVLYRDSDPDLLSTELHSFKVCKATIDAYCRKK